MTFFNLKRGVPPFGLGRMGQKKFHPPPRVGQSEKSWEFVLSDGSVQNPAFSSNRQTPRGQGTRTQYGFTVKTRYTEDFDQKKALFSDFGPQVANNRPHGSPTKPRKCQILNAQPPKYPPQKKFRSTSNIFFVAKILRLH